MKTTRLVVAALAFAPAATGAQVDRRSHPADAAAPVPVAEYRSAFSGYLPHQEQPVGDWRKLIEGLGPPGWGPGSQAAQPGTARPPLLPGPGTAPAAPPPHAGHGAGRPR